MSTRYETAPDPAEHPDWLVQIVKTAPDVGRIPDDVRIKLESWLEVHGDPSVYEPCYKWVQYLELVREYNHRLRESDIPAAQKGGRPKLSEVERQRRERIVIDWEQAKGAGVTGKQFCSDQRLEYSYLETVLSWAAKRRSRDG